MRFRPLICVAVVLVALPLTVISADHKNNQSEQQQAVLELEQRWLQAEDNPDALESILAGDFIHVLPFGFITKADQIQYLRSHPASDHRTSKHFEELRARIFGTAAVVTGIVVATSADGKTQKTIFTDVFAYRNGRWQAVNAQELPFSEARP